MRKYRIDVTMNTRISRTRRHLLVSLFVLLFVISIFDDCKYVPVMAMIIAVMVIICDSVTSYDIVKTKQGITDYLARNSFCASVFIVDMAEQAVNVKIVLYDHMATSLLDIRHEYASVWWDRSL
jgi:hypothetical protein